MGTVNPQPRGCGGRPGQAGFVQHGASRASPGSPRLILPSFSTEEEDNDDEDDNSNGDDNNDDDNDDNDGDEDTKDEEVDFPNQGNVQ